MNDDLTTIREMCEQFDVTARTLRFYEAKELLNPQRDGQKRLFSKRDKARLTLILRGKRFGFSLEDMRQLLDLYDVGDRQQAQLTSTHKLARKRLEALKDQRNDLDKTISDLQDQIRGGEEMIREATRKTA